MSRTTDDYQAMAIAGCAAVCEPAFWAGFDRSGPQGFYDYFCQLTDYEPKRAAKFAKLWVKSTVSKRRVTFTALHLTI